MKNQDVFIKVFFNRRETFGVKEFKEALVKDNYLCQIKPKYIPAASEGGEIWFELFMNVSFWILGNLAWDCLKSFFCNIIKLEKVNETSFGLKIHIMKFHFDDIDIVVGAFKPSNISILNNIVYNLLNSGILLKKEVMVLK